MDTSVFIILAVSTVVLAVTPFFVFTYILLIYKLHRTMAKRSLKVRRLSPEFFTLPSFGRRLYSFDVALFYPDHILTMSSAQLSGHTEKDPTKIVISDIKSFEIHGYSVYALAKDGERYLVSAEIMYGFIFMRSFKKASSKIKQQLTELYNLPVNTRAYWVGWRRIVAIVGLLLMAVVISLMMFEGMRTASIS